MEVSSAVTHVHPGLYKCGCVFAWVFCVIFSVCDFVYSMCVFLCLWELLCVCVGMCTTLLCMCTSYVWKCVCVSYICSSTASVCCSLCLCSLLHPTRHPCLFFMGTGTAGHPSRAFSQWENHNIWAWCHTLIHTHTHTNISSLKITYSVQRHSPGYCWQVSCWAVVLQRHQDLTAGVCYRCKHVNHRSSLFYFSRC